MLQSHTHHKPLEAIVSKPLSAALAGLQRMMLRLPKYDLTVHHKPGNEIPVANTLSRLHLNEADEAFAAQVHLVVTSLLVSDQTSRTYKPVVHLAPTWSHQRGVARSPKQFCTISKALQELQGLTLRDGRFSVQRRKIF